VLAQNIVYFKMICVSTEYELNHVMNAKWDKFTEVSI